ncbi:MAG: hypothetical protein CL946_07540 [Ectothiorhodospiraceae bacterium]|nr:hypothetical protein [Ectothiorhodospiraceae bacterium]
MLRSFRVLLLVCSSVLAGCSGIDLPDAGHSREKIARLETQIAEYEKSLDMLAPAFYMSQDIQMEMKPVLFNRILQEVASSRSDDVRFTFAKSNDIVHEWKSTLGIRYKNHLDIDTGKINVNLRQFRILELRDESIPILLQLSGNGGVSVSGKYMGITAKTSPDLALSVLDTVRFSLGLDEDGRVVLLPLQRNIPLLIEARFSLLGWKVPYQRKEYLRITDILQPVPLPVEFASKLRLPFPSETPGQNKVEFQETDIHITGISVLTENNRLYLGANASVVIRDTVRNTP